MEPSSNEHRDGLLPGRKTYFYDSSNTWFSNLASIVICYLLYSVFSQYTSDITYYESTECVVLLKHSKSIGNLYYYYLIFSGVFAVAWLININLVSLKLFIQLMVNLIIFVYLFMITGDLFKGEPCGELRTLAKIWAIYEWVCISCICCSICCLCCAAGVGVLALSADNNRRRNSNS